MCTGDVCECFRISVLPGLQRELWCFASESVCRWICVDMCECEHWSSDSDEEDEELQLSHHQHHQWMLIGTHQPVQHTAPWLPNPHNCTIMTCLLSCMMHVASMLVVLRSFQMTPPMWKRTVRVKSCCIRRRMKAH